MFGNLPGTWNLTQNEHTWYEFDGVRPRSGRKPIELVVCVYILGRIPVSREMAENIGFLYYVCPSLRKFKPGNAKLQNIKRSSVKNLESWKISQDGQQIIIKLKA